MIGKDYYSWGSNGHITHRFGDNNGNPFTGPIKMCPINPHQLLVMSKSGTLSVQNLVGAVETNIYPVRPKSKSTKYQSSGELIQMGEDEINDEWEERAIASDTNETKQSQYKIRSLKIENLPLAIDCNQIMHQIAVVDDRSQIRVFDFPSLKLISKFGDMGNSLPHHIISPTAIACLQIGQESLIVVGDSGDNQRVSIFTVDGKLVTQVGGPGPKLGQFRDIEHISMKPNSFPNYYKAPRRSSQSSQSSISSDKMAFSAAHPRSSPSSLPFPPSTILLHHQQSSTLQLSPTLPDIYHFPYSPKWYRGQCSREELEDSFYQTDFDSNFVIGKRIHSHHSQDEFDRTSVSSSSSINGDSQIVFVEENFNDFKKIDPHGIYDVLYISASKKILRLTLKYHKETSFANSGFHLINQAVDASSSTASASATLIYPTFYDFLQQNPYHQAFRIRDEIRDLQMMAITDRGNYRIQILRFYWTESLLYTPSLEAVDWIGGYSNHYVNLQDPLSACFAHSGELAIIDRGKMSVILLTPYYQFIKILSLQYIPIRELQGTKTIPKRLMSQKSNLRSSSSSNSTINSTSNSNSNSNSHSSSNSNSQSFISSFHSISQTSIATTTKLSAEEIAEQAAIKQSKTVSTCCFLPDNSLVVGFYSGGKLNLKIIYLILNDIYMIFRIIYLSSKY
jgi:hypothetical protein